MLGRNLESPENRAIVERAAAGGHIIGNHGYSLFAELRYFIVREMADRKAVVFDFFTGVNPWQEFDAG